MFFVSSIKTCQDNLKHLNIIIQKIELNIFKYLNLIFLTQTGETKS